MHAHTEDTGDPRAATTILVGLVGVIMLLAIVLFTIALFYDVERYEMQRKVYARQPPEIAALRAEQQEKLYGYRWVNQKEGIVGIPIDRAIELTVRDLKSDGRPPTIRPTDDQQPSGTSPGE